MIKKYWKGRTFLEELDYDLTLIGNDCIWGLLEAAGAAGFACAWNAMG